ncbi:MAG: DUF1805 domain-containing protein [Candidatus Omnitrophota bacterium]
MAEFIEDTIFINNTAIQTFLIKLPHANLILAVAPKGIIMCGYMDIDVAQKLNDAAGIVSGVKTVKELLEKPIVKLTVQAEKLGVRIGLSGEEALRLMV